MNGPEKLDEAFKVAKAHALSVLKGAIEQQLGSSGETYGMEVVQGGDFLAFYEDLRAREFQLPSTPIPDPETGEPVGEIPGEFVTINVLEMLRGINPRLAEQYDREFERQTQHIADRVG